MSKGALESRVVVIRDLELTAKIGVYTHERQDSQPIRINLAMTVGHAPVEDRLDDTVSYDAIVEGVKALLAEGHINLVETLAERIADLCLEQDLVEKVHVRVEKLHAVAEAAGVGAEIIKSAPPPG
jgi:dihydroneopterin aldolase